MDKWYCTYCSEQHAPDLGTLIDARYAIGSCHGTRRTLVRGEAEAERLSRSGGKFRPKGVPIGGGQPKVVPKALDAEQTRALQGGGRHGL